MKYSIIANKSTRSCNRCACFVYILDGIFILNIDSAYLFRYMKNAYFFEYVKRAYLL